MFKAIALTLATLFIAAVQVSTADARCGSHGRVYQSKISKSYALKQSRARKAHAVAAAKKRKSIQQARAAKADTAPVEKTAATVSEPTPVEESAEAVENVDTVDKTDVASIKKTCTKFVAETGTTVTFECAQQ